MSRIAVSTLIGVSLVLGLVSPEADAQDDRQHRSELGVRQKLVERRMTELENKLTIIADRLREKEPERAARLVEAYQQSKQLLITRKMAEVSELLDQSQFGQAEQKLNEVIQSLESLIRILVDQKEPPMSKEQEMEMLERWKDKVQERIKEQKEQRRETEKISHREDATRKLDAQIKKLEGLIGKQKEVIQSTEQQSNRGLRELDKVADKQFEVRQGTEALARELAGDDAETAKSNAQEQGGSDSSQAENGKAAGRTGEANSEEGRPKDDQPKDDRFQGDPSQPDPSQREQPQPNQPKADKEKESQSSDATDSDSPSQAGQPNSAKPKSGASGSGESKPGQPRFGEAKSGKPTASAPQPGQQPLQRATESQRRAEEKLSSGKAADAKRQQQDALENMQAALSELKKEKRRIESLPPEALRQMAEQQRRTRDKAMELVEAMKQAPKGEQQQQQASAENESASQPQPGQQPMEQAGDSMQQAAKSLEESDSENAQQKQKQSQDKMEQALQEIEDRLNQLREETREEKLARLEARFQEMLERQVSASVMTVELDDRRTSLNTLRRRDLLTLLQLANEELEIREVGQQTYDLLLEDGTSFVFPEIVHELRQQLEHAAQLLQAERTDQFTQLIQKEIEFTIQDLLDALKEAKNDSKQGGGGGGGGGENPLLKKSAELKILRMQQLRLNRRAKKIEQLRSAAEATMIENETQKAAEFQQKLIQMLEGILEKEGSQ
jgi:hypothetical protein